MQINEQYPFNIYMKQITQKMKEKNDLLLKSYHLNTSQGIILWHINKSILEKKAVNRKYLQAVSGLSGPSITNLLQGLEKLQFIKRTLNIEDNRNLKIEITKKAILLLDKMHLAFLETENTLTKNMSNAEKNEFKKLLKKAYDNIKEAK